MTGLFPDEPQSAQDDTNAGYDFEQYSVWGLKMKSSMIMASVVLAAAAGAAQAGTVTVRYTPFQTGQGGEFRIEQTSGYSGVINRRSDIDGSITADNTATNGKILSSGGQFYDTFSKVTGNAAQQANAITQRNAARSIRDFQTFCIERSENVGNNTTYAFSINTGAFNGGNGGGNPDQIGNYTAFLYQSFRNGTLAGYNLWGASVTEAMRESSAKTLQHVLWYFENELGNTNNDTDANPANDFTVANLTNNPAGPADYRLFGQNPNGLDAAQQAQATTWATLAINAVANGYTNQNVRALNLWVDDGDGIYEVGEGLVQSQLTIIPLPTGAALGLAGLSVLAIRRRAAR